MPSQALTAKKSGSLVAPYSACQALTNALLATEGWDAV
jgi:hypothetical protein